MLVYFLWILLLVQWDSRLGFMGTEKNPIELLLGSFSVEILGSANREFPHPSQFPFGKLLQY